MKIVKSKFKTKCDVYGCKNFAEHTFLKEHDNKECFLVCSDCAKEIYLAIGKIIVPQSIDAPYKSPKTNRRK